MKLYRAAKNTDLPRFACFAEDRQDAVYYTDNCGFGGPTVYTAVVSPDEDRVLRLDGDASDCLLSLLELVGFEHADDRAEFLSAGFASCCGSLLSDRRGVTVIEQLVGQYDWMVFTDSAPEDCRTWMRLSDAAVSFTVR